MADLPSCAFYQTEVESVEHLLFPVEYHLVFGNMSYPCCAIITSLLITLKRKMSFLVSLILQKIFSFLTILCFWVSFIFTLGNTRMVYLLFKVLQPGQGVFTISNSILPGKRDKLNNHFRKWEKLLSVLGISDVMINFHHQF